MKHTNTGVEDRDQWRARILRALVELRNEESVTVSHMRQNDDRNDAAVDSAKL
jgi:hypothetical protein